VDVEMIQGQALPSVQRHTVDEGSLHPHYDSGWTVGSDVAMHVSERLLLATFDQMPQQHTLSLLDDSQQVFRSQRRPRQRVA
jgi:hypothetical protein